MYLLEIILELGDCQKFDGLRVVVWTLEHVGPGLLMVVTDRAAIQSKGIKKFLLLTRVEPIMHEFDKT